MTRSTDTRSTDHDGERGQAMVEFALIVPVLFLLVFGIIQTGLLFGKQLDLKSATRDGARRGAVSMTNADPATVARQGVLRSLALTHDTDVAVTVSPAAPWQHGDQISVKSSTPYEYNIMGVTLWKGSLRAEAKIRVE
ncbi:MAG: TadE family protein [Thermoleophilia bacterium]|nr:TadE family protein [Thermoleophilia bacterium]